MMGKPEIIGYQQAGDRLIPHPDMRDTWVNHRNGHIHTSLKCESMDLLLLSQGWKRVYKPREFHAAWRHDGYRLTCKSCGTDYRTALLPHDASKLHAERNHHSSTSWPRDLVE